MRIATLDRRMCALAGTGIESWILHDLRRSAATGMARLAIAPHVVDKILNHVSGTIRGVAAVYNRQLHPGTQGGNRGLGAIRQRDSPSFAVKRGRDAQTVGIVTIGAARLAAERPVLPGLPRRQSAGAPQEVLCRIMRSVAA